MLKNYMTNLLASVEGCSAILVYDTNKESSPLFRIGELTDIELNGIKHNLNVFNTSIDRVDKLCRGNSSKTIMAFYNHHQLYIFSKATIVFIIVASSEANAGMILSLRNYLEPLVSEIQSSSLMHDTVSTASFSNLASATNVSPTPIQTKSSKH
jgi:hypothetical protein